MPIKRVHVIVSKKTPINRDVHQQLVDIKQKTAATQTAIQLLRDNIDIIE